MTYSKNKQFITLEQNGLKVILNYDMVIEKINQEIKNSYIYEEGTKGNNLYFFGKKGITQNDYIDSLVEIKDLIDKIFTEHPIFNIFDYFEYSKKGLFCKNGRVNIASPITFLFIHCNEFYYERCKCIEGFTLVAKVQNETTATVDFLYSSYDINKFHSLFFEDYTKPVLKEKLSAIKRADLKLGTIYSDEKHKKFFLYLGTPTMARDINFTSYAYKKSKTLLDVDDFTDEDIRTTVIEKNKNKKNKIFLFCWLTKKEYEEISKLRKQEDFETFVKNNIAIPDRIRCYEVPIRVFHEEFDYLKDIKPCEVIHKEVTFFQDNVSGPGFCRELDKDYYTGCKFLYLKYE